MKTLFLKLLMASLCLGTVACGQIELMSLDEAGFVASSPEARVKATEASAENFIGAHKLVNKKFGKKQMTLIKSLANSSNPFALAQLILDKKTTLSELLTWADTLINAINAVSSPNTAKKIAEITALRNATTDRDIRRRYTEIIVRMTAASSVTRVNVTSLKRHVEGGIRSTKRAQEFMVGGSIWVTAFFLLFATDIYDKVIDIEITLQYLKENL
ncbi:MAG: hypothetical protein HAW63_01765 [Bdellovibrionaceae bacterium]|nr:hypothetical protein [Pseudobdellovibrionaceae bacterium]